MPKYFFNTNILYTFAASKRQKHIVSLLKYITIMNTIPQQIAALNNANAALEKLAYKTLNNIMDNMNTDIISFPPKHELFLTWGTFTGMYIAVRRDEEKHIIFDMMSKKGTTFLPDHLTPRGINVMLEVIDHITTLQEKGFNLAPDLSGFEELDKRMSELPTATIVNMF